MCANFEPDGFSCADENVKKKLKEKSKVFGVSPSASR